MWIVSAFVWYLALAGADLAPNTTLMYPLQEISKLECRMTHWTDHSADCKMVLPRIKSAQYSKHIDDEWFTKYYTVLWKWAYSKEPWNTKWSHVWVDIASAQWPPTFAFANGVVHEARQQAGYGNVVKIKFSRKWQTYYAIYAHLDQIAPGITPWATVSQWDKIWEVWNSGVSSWKMWWYHLHFEIDKEIGWRLVYAFWECEDRDMWANEYSVVDEWLCRDKLEERTVDPIVFLENANATIKSANVDIVPDTGKEPVIETKPVEPTKQLPDTIALVQKSANISVKDINTTFLDEATKEFVASHQFSVKAWSFSTQKGWTVSIEAKNTKNGEQFGWILPSALEIIAENTAITINPSQVTFVAGAIDFAVKTPKEGSHNLIVKSAWQQLATINVDVQAWQHAAAWSFACRYQTQEERMKYFF